MFRRNDNLPLALGLSISLFGTLPALVHCLVSRYSAWAFWLATNYIICNHMLLYVVAKFNRKASRESFCWEATRGLIIPDAGIKLITDRQCCRQTSLHLAALLSLPNHPCYLAHC